MKIMDLYHQISNPLDSDDNLMKVVNVYCSEGAFYDAIIRTLTKSTPSKIKGRYSIKDSNQFYVLLFVCWKKNLIKLYQKNRIVPDYKAACLKTIRFLENFHPTTREEVTKFLFGDSIKDPDVKEFVDLTRWNRCGEFSVWDHINSSYIFLGNQENYEFEHRLYINCDSTVLYRLMYKFIRKCLERKIKFYFKYDEGSYRDDAMVIYCDTKHLPCLINILREITQEDELIRKSSYAPTILSGAIDGWIGYGSEPELLPNGKRTSFNTKRANHLQSCIDKLVFSHTLENQNRTIRFTNGKTALYKDYLIECIVHDKIEQLSGTLKYYKDPKKSRGYDEKDLHSPRFCQILKNVVVNNYATIVNSIETGNSFSFPVSFDNARIYLNKGDVEKTIRNQLKIFFKDSKFRQRLKTAIRESSQEVGIDPNNYAFDLRAVEQFKAFDKAMESFASKQSKTKTVPPKQAQAKQTQPKQRRRNQYTPMTDAEILASRRKINAVPLTASSNIKSMNINREHPYTEPYHLRNKSTKSGMFDYNLERERSKQYKK